MTYMDRGEYIKIRKEESDRESEEMSKVEQ
jgi:hypothetical protein